MTIESSLSDETTSTVELATELTMAWLSNPNTRTSAEDVPTFLKSMHDAVIGLSTATVQASAEEATPEFTGAVTARKSLANPDVIISMIDGKPYKTLTRHLSTNGLTAAEYRARYGLKADYPMTAPSYSAMRRDMAKKIGLGRKPGQKAPVRLRHPHRHRSVVVPRNWSNLLEAPGGEHAGRVRRRSNHYRKADDRPVSRKKRPGWNWVESGMAALKRRSG